MKYTEKPEIILLSGVDTNLKPFHIKEVKVRMNRGKEFSTDKITSSQMAYDIFKKLYGRSSEVTCRKYYPVTQSSIRIPPIIGDMPMIGGIRIRYGKNNN